MAAYLVVMEGELLRLGNYNYRLKPVLWRLVYCDAFIAA